MPELQSLYQDRQPVVENARHCIDLDAPAAERWREVIAKESDAAHELADAAWRDILDKLDGKINRPRISAAIAGGMTYPLLSAYRLKGGPYQEEIRAWAKALDLPEARLTALQCVYSLSHLGIRDIGPGCTSVVVKQDNDRWLHGRTLDWGEEIIGPAIPKATRVFDFYRNGKRIFQSIGLLGYIGMLSGLSSTGYSVTLNWAPRASLPRIKAEPTLLLRRALELNAGFEDTVRYLSDTPSSTAVFYTLCGTAKDEACVIEKTRQGRQSKTHIRSLEQEKTGFLVQSNHYAGSAFSHLNQEVHDAQAYAEQAGLSWEQQDLRMNSLARKRQMESVLNGGGNTPEQLLAALKAEPVFNSQTRQIMLMEPESGDLRLWAVHH